MSILNRLEDQFIPFFVNRFNSDFVFVRWEYGETTKGDIQNASSILFISAVFQNKSIVTKIPLIIKCQVSNSKVRDWLKLEEQFSNEVYAYENILPFLNNINGIIDDLYPLYYYGCCTSSRPEDDVIVLQDLRPDGFMLSKEIVCLDFDHCAVAMKKIGRYHALSYNAKKYKSKEFYDVIKGLKECRFREDMVEVNYHLFQISCRRAVQPFLDRNEHVGIINRFLRNIEDANNFLFYLVQPEEPLAVICHGDFCRNNILFRYDSTDKPIDAKLFDIATSRYSSPAIDLSFFMLLNTTYESRQHYWDVFLKIYHDALVETAEDGDVPSLDDVKQEVRKKAVYGFAICSTFLPSLLDEEIWVPEDLCDLPNSEKNIRNATVGGQRGTDMVADIFKDLVERGCIE